MELAEPRSITTRDGRTYEYRVCRRREGRIFAAIGGLFVGLISAGLGEADSYVLVRRCRIPTRVAVATGVVVVAVTALVASVTHLVDFVQPGGDALSTVRGIVVFTVPGVIIGGQLGPQVTRRVTERTLVLAATNGQAQEATAQAEAVAEATGEDLSHMPGNYI